MTHHLHTVIVTYQRQGLTERTLNSYLETVTLPYSLLIVDNRSDPEMQDWLRSTGQEILFLNANYFPGYAANAGWAKMPPQTTLLQRSDNDTLYLPNWCDEMVEAFEDPKVGQYGPTGEGDGPWAEMPTWPVGGNSIVARKLWDEGLRYDARPWSPLWGQEDQQLTRDVWDMGYERVFGKRPGIEYLGGGGDEEYYNQTRRVRGLP